MQNVKIITVGKLKEKYLTAGCAEYLKRLGGFCRAQVLELPESKTPNNPSENEVKKALEEEEKAILAKIPPQATVIALCVEGKLHSSEEMAQIISPANTGANLVFVLGSSHGLSDGVKARADVKLSFSKMTFPHQLMRLILLEQLYRAYTINAGMRYHK